MIFRTSFSLRKKWLFIGLLLCAISFGLWHGFFRREKREWARVPVTYTSNTEDPLVSVEIEGREYLFLLDTGYSSFFTMKKRALQGIHDKKFRRSATITDLTGKDLVMDTYILPEVHMSNLIARDFEIIEEPDGPEGNSPVLFDFRENKEVPLEEPIGKVGSRLLAGLKNGVFLDLMNSVVYLNADFSQLRKEGYQLEGMVEAPITFDKAEGILLFVDTDWGKRRFFLDTGCTKSAIRRECIPEDAVCKEWGPETMAYYTSHFWIGGKDFGEQSFLLFPFASDLEKIDGTLGMDFFKKHRVYLDFANRVAYFGKSEKKRAQ